MKAQAEIANAVSDVLTSMKSVIAASGNAITSINSCIDAQTNFLNSYAESVADMQESFKAIEASINQLQLANK